MTFTISQNKSWQKKLLSSLNISAFFAAIFGLVIFSFQFFIGINSTLNIVGNYLTPFFLGQNFSDIVRSFPSWLVNIGGKTFLRTFGSLPDPHIFALFLNMILPSSFFIWQDKKRKGNNSKVYFLIFTTILLVSLLTFSRAAYLSLFSAIFLFLFFHKKHLLTKNLILKKPLILPLIITIFIFSIIIPNPLTNRLFSSLDLKEGSNEGRILMWQAGWQMTQENLLLGVGIGNFSRELFPDSAYRNPIYAHNLFLDFSAETGIFNATILLLIILLPIFKTLKNPTNQNQIVALSLIILLTHSIFETPIFSIHIFPLLLIFLAIENKDDDTN